MKLVQPIDLRINLPLNGKISLKVKFSFSLFLDYGGQSISLSQIASGADQSCRRAEILGSKQA